jgi:hypothetical protein
MKPRRNGMHVSGEIEGARIQVANRISELVRALCFNPRLKNRRRSQDGRRCRYMPLQRLLERVNPNSESFGPRWNNVAGSLEIRAKHPSLHRAISVREAASIRALSADLGLSWRQRTSHFRLPARFRLRWPRRSRKP